MRSFKHWTSRYVLDRSLNIACNLIHPDWPWLTREAVRFLDLWLKPTDVVFEWGGGRSTLWIAQRVQWITSVEHDPGWFARIKSRAASQNLGNINLKFCPERQSSTSESEYVAAIHGVGDNFDLVVVDGLFRERCALGAIPRLKPGGVLLVDNANWYLPSAGRCPASRSEKDGPASGEWARFAEQVSNWRLMWTTNGVTDTAVWFRPGQAGTVEVKTVAEQNASCLSR